MLNYIRKQAFWTLDFIKGGKVKKHYKEIKFVYENYEKPEAKQIIVQNINKIIDHSVNNVPFYKEFNNVKTLEDLPVVNKNTIKENYDSFVSIKKEKENLFFVTTSGSTGTPFKSYQDNIKRSRHTADNIFFNEMAKTKIGSRLYYFRIWNQLNKKSFIKSVFQNIIMLDAGSFDIAFVKRLVKSLKTDASKKSMLAYASTYEALIQTIEKYFSKPLNIDMNAIISMSESLPLNTKEQLKFYFNCPVISRYSNMENGFIAQQCIDDNEEYHINHASFYVEILALDDDIPVKSGEPGRIVVTDLFNYGMSFLRYDTGDIGILDSDSKCKNKMPVLRSVMGRKVDFIYAVDGTLLSPHIITNTMWKFPDIQQFQFIQKTNKDYLMKLTIHGKEDKFLERNMENELKKFLGDKSIISFEYFDEIPLLSSGKRKKIVNEYIKQR